MTWGMQNLEDIIINEKLPGASRIKTDKNGNTYEEVLYDHSEDQEQNFDLFEYFGNLYNNKRKLERAGQEVVSGAIVGGTAEAALNIADTPLSLLNELTNGSIEILDQHINQQHIRNKLDAYFSNERLGPVGGVVKEGMQVGVTYGVSAYLANKVPLSRALPMHRLLKVAMTELFAGSFLPSAGDPNLSTLVKDMYNLDDKQAESYSEVLLKWAGSTEGDDVLMSKIKGAVGDAYVLSTTFGGIGLLLQFPRILRTIKTEQGLADELAVNLSVNKVAPEENLPLAEKAIQTDAQKDEAVKLFNEIKQDQQDFNNALQEFGEENNFTTQKFKASDVKRVVAKLKKEGKVIGYSRENLEKVAAKNLETLFMNAEEVESLFKLANRFKDTDQEFKPDALAKILRFDAKRALDKGYVSKYQKGLTEYFAKEYDKYDIADKTLNKEEFIKTSVDIGWDDAVAQFLTKKKNENFRDAQTAFKAVLFKEAIEIELDRLTKIITNPGMAEAGTDLNAVALEIADIRDATKFILPNIYGGMSEGGRTLQAFAGTKSRLKSYLDSSGQSNKSYVDELTALYKNEGNTTEEIREWAKNYLTLSKSQKGRYVAKSIQGRIWDVSSGASRRTNSLYVQSLLGSPDTAVKNMLSGMLRAASFFIEQPSAAVAAKIRKEMPEVQFFKSGDQEAAEFYDTVIGAVAEIETFNMIGKNARDAWKRMEAIDPEQKILQIDRTPFRTDEQIDALDHADWFKTLIKARNRGLQLAGRALTSGDEAVKTAIFNRELFISGFKKAQKTLRETGDFEQAESVLAKHLTDFDPEDLEYPLEVARADTLTTGSRKGGSFTKQLSKLTEFPLLKFYIPLKRAFTNMVSAGIQTTPLVSMASARFRKEFMAGGIRRDRAIGKNFLGLALIIDGAMQSCDLSNSYDQTFCITGTKPRSRQEQQQWDDLNLKPYSFNARNPGDDKFTFNLSYELAFPFNMTLALGANLGYFTKKSDSTNPEWESDLSQLYELSALAVAPYVEQGAFIQPLSNMFDDIENYVYAQDKIDYTGKYLTEVMGQYGRNYVQMETIGSFGIGNPSTLRWIEKIFNPEAVETAPPDYMGPFGLNEGLFDEDSMVQTELGRVVNKIMSSTPGLSDDLLVKTDNRGEVIKDNPGVIFNFFAKPKEFIDYLRDKADGDMFPAEKYFTDNGVFYPEVADIRNYEGTTFTQKELGLYRDTLINNKIVPLNYNNKPIIDKEMTYMETLDFLAQNESFQKIPARSEFKYQGQRYDQESIVKNVFEQYNRVAIKKVRNIYPEFVNREGLKEQRKPEVITEDFVRENELKKSLAETF